MGLLTAVASIVLAAALLGAGRLKRPIWDPAPTVGRGALLRFRRLHSGQTGDYVDVARGRVRDLRRGARGGA